MENIKTFKPLLIVALTIILGLQYTFGNKISEYTENKQGRSISCISQGEYDFEGNVTNKSTFEEKNTDKKTLIVILDTGRMNDELVVDLGPLEDLKGYAIKKGKNIKVQGKIVNVDGKEFIMAKELWIGNQKLNINRYERTRLPATQQSEDK